MAGEQTLTLTALDGVPISAMHIAAQSGGDEVGFVVVHGFTGNWRQERVQKIIRRLRDFGGVVALDLRGHGRSGGATTVGDEEVLDVAAAVAWARELGYRQVVTVGFSLGGAVVLREAALMAQGSGAVDAVVSVSAPAFWFYRGTRIMRIAHWMVETAPGRALMRVRRTRISSRGWPEEHPVSPSEAAALLPGIPLLVVHGDADHYFPLEHPHAIHAAALAGGASRSELWIESGIGHAESAIPEETIDRIGQWALSALAAEADTAGGRRGRAQGSDEA
ncbi:MAG TPA: alpha/beta hydrolase [Actinobacteria bacterium]|nr:alpha/beta hydrolase [Actinomycetota bacterium]